MFFWLLTTLFAIAKTVLKTPGRFGRSGIITVLKPGELSTPAPKMRRGTPIASVKTGEITVIIWAS